MTHGPSQSGPHSTTSYAHGGMYRGRIENIIDPQNRNRVQVRIIGYQDDRGLMPSDKLEWIHVSQHNSQLPSHGATQPYYVGAQVIIVDTGNERYVLGGIPGFDAPDREQSNQKQADTSPNKSPDTPLPHHPEKLNHKESSIRASSGMIPSANSFASMIGGWKTFIPNIKFLYPYATGHGEKPAPFGKGTIAQLDGFKTIGHNKLIPKSDILDIIKNLDGNISGSIQASLDIIKNLRNNGFGTGISTVGGGNVASADATFNGNFAAQALGPDLNSLLLALIQAIQLIASLTKDNLQSKLVEVSGALTLISNPIFEVDANTLQAIDDELQKINSLINNNIPLTVAFMTNETNAIQSLFAPAFIQALTAIMNLINNVADIYSNPPDLVGQLGGMDGFAAMGQVLKTAAALLGISPSTVDNLANGLLGQALTGQLAKNIGNVAGGGGNSGGGSASNPLGGLMSIFQGNPIALKEIMGGGLIKEFMSKNPIKYETNDRNDGPNPLKQFKKNRENQGSSPSASNPKNQPKYKSGEIAEAGAIPQAGRSVA